LGRRAGLRFKLLETIKMHSEALGKYGWDTYYESAFDSVWKEGLAPGRVLEENRQGFRVYTTHGEVGAEVSGRFRFKACGRESFPAVGDWVVLRLLPGENRAIIEAVLPRKSQFIRKAAGKQTEAQVVGANMDWVFVMMSLNQDFNARRLERYLVLVWESGASPVVILSKSDLCNDEETAVASIREATLNVSIHAISALTGQGLQELRVYLGAGKTIALLGSSGVGKSTLVNGLLGEALLKTQPIRAHDDRGLHTTASRQLIVLPNGGLVLDTPGMRELQLWEAEDGVQKAFEDIEVQAHQCRFRDCTHEHEPDCAVREALKEGTLDEGRYQSYQKLQRELRHLAVKQDLNAQRSEKQKWKVLSRMAKDRAALKLEGR
jgi:ribosome biogenesis GTPase / thiamine phosphate phosphatase